MSQFTLLVQSALGQGADIAIQSTHKVLGSMGQSSMLHAQGALVDRSRISRALQTLQVSRPLSVLTLMQPSPVISAAMQPALPIVPAVLVAECAEDFSDDSQSPAVAAESYKRTMRAHADLKPQLPADGIPGRSQAPGCAAFHLGRTKSSSHAHL